MGSEKDVIESEATTYTVQEAAERTGLTAHTLRYYERVGLVDPPQRVSENGHRRYGVSDIRRLIFLKCLRATGMPIREMQNFIGLYQQGDNTLRERERIMEEQRCQVLAQIATLQECLATIDYKLASYREHGTENNWTGRKGVCGK